MANPACSTCTICWWCCLNKGCHCFVFSKLLRVTCYSLETNFYFLYHENTEKVMKISVLVGMCTVTFDVITFLFSWNIHQFYQYMYVLNENFIEWSLIKITCIFQTHAISINNTKSHILNGNYITQHNVIKTKNVLFK